MRECGKDDDMCCGQLCSGTVCCVLRPLGQCRSHGHSPGHWPGHQWWTPGSCLTWDHRDQCLDRDTGEAVSG